MTITGRILRRRTPTETPAPDAEHLAAVPQRALVWRAFRRHRLAMAGLVVTGLFYLMALFGGFLAPFSSDYRNAPYTYAPPQQLHFFSRDEDGDIDLGLYVNGLESEQDPETFEITWTEDEDTRIPVHLFARGEPYSFLGLFETDIHLIGPADPDQPMFLLGSDSTGRDVLSLIIHGAQISLSIGLLGVAVAFVIGVTLGGISGYVGGKTDTVIQRIVEFFMSIPTLPLWLGLAAALPGSWDALQRYFAITVIVSIIAWTDLARVVRGRFLSLRQEEFVTAARLDGSSAPRVIFRHMLPSFSSHLIASLTLSIPGMILAETALSFLGLGIQSPEVSWGVLLQEAQNVRAVSTAPWLLFPGVAVVIVVLSMNFLGDGLRDAADPYRT
ncbi:ABC transporter permease [Streptomyces sp. 6N223]|uniref:ABC transporter permease n=1 Tax=Streptomyces sp. 6N223 TaxID=3457412 RepID=UPI003FD297ED